MNPELIKREIRRKATRAFRSSIGQVGSFLPFQTKLRLAQNSTKLGYLLLNDGEFEWNKFLGQYKIFVDVRYPAERSMLANKCEADLLWVIGNIIQSGDVCLDIGANVGSVTLPLAHKVGPSGKVIAFEPGPSFFSRLRRNIESNAELAKRVELHNLGLAEKKGELFWEEDPQFPGNAYCFGNKGTRVEVTTLDSLLGDKLKNLDFVKIDVEGMEEEVLLGAKKILEKFKPKIFLETAMEFETYRQKPTRKQVTEFLLEHGYDLFSIEPGQGKVPVQYPQLKANTLAIPKS